MGGSTGLTAYPESPDHIWWISDGKRRRDMTPEELEERHRKDRETYRRMRERMAIDPEYREARLAVSRRTTQRYRERNPPSEEQKAKRRARDNARYAERSAELGERRRESYVGAHAERIRARNREWYARNREGLNARRKAKRRQNADAIRAQERERQRREYALDPKKFNDYQKEWRARNPDKAHMYVRISGHKRRVAADGTNFTAEEWLALVDQYDGRCAYCGERGSLEMEHKIPLSRGGTNSIDNIVPSCKRCNRRKRSKTDAEFREFLAREGTTKGESSARAPDPDGSAPAG